MPVLRHTRTQCTLSPLQAAIRGAAPLLALLVVTATGLLPAYARQVDVDVRDFRFGPDRVSIDVGDTVTWRVTQGQHTITAENGSFASGERSPGEILTVRFDRPGRFAYYCEYDRQVGMTGVVEVRGTAAGAVAPPATAAAPPSSTTTTSAATTTTAAPTTTTTTSPPTTTTTAPLPAETLAALLATPPPPVPPTEPPTDGSGAAVPAPAPVTEAPAESVALSGDNEGDERSSGAILALSLFVAALLIGAAAYAWYHRPSRYLPA